MEYNICVLSDLVLFIWFLAHFLIYIWFKLLQIHFFN